jgi:hypothetical protein
MLQEDYETKPPMRSKPKSQGRGLIEEIVNLSSEDNTNGSGNGSGEEEEGEDETITTVLALLGSIMELGSFQRDEKEEKILRSLILPALQIIATGDHDTSLREMASDVALMIMVRGDNGKRRKQSTQATTHAQEKEERGAAATAGGGGESETPFTKELREIEIDLLDPEPPIRAYGIRRILTYLRAPTQVHHSPPLSSSAFLSSSSSSFSFSSSSFSFSSVFPYPPPSPSLS